MSFLDPNAPILVNAITEKSHFLKGRGEDGGRSRVESFPTLKRELTSLKILRDPADLAKIEKIVKEETESCFRSIFVRKSQGPLGASPHSILHKKHGRCECCCRRSRKSRVFSVVGKDLMELASEQKAETLDSAYICSELIQFLQIFEVRCKSQVKTCEFYLDRISSQLYGFNSQSLRFKLVEMIARILNASTGHT